MWQPCIMYGSCCKLSSILLSWRGNVQEAPETLMPHPQVSCPPSGRAKYNIVFVPLYLNLPQFVKQRTPTQFGHVCCVLDGACMFSFCSRDVVVCNTDKGNSSVYMKTFPTSFA